MKQPKCDRCGIELGASIDYFDVRTKNMKKYSHKREKYVCAKCVESDPRYMEEQNDRFSTRTA
jgi:hypothetical protein